MRLFTERKNTELDEVVEIDSNSAEMVFLEQELHPDRGLDETGIINMFSQAIWKFFEDNRNFFANMLVVEELDAVLADARVLSVDTKKGKVHKLEELIDFFDPIKVRAYTTVARRDVLPDGAYAIVEPGAVRAKLAARKENKPLLLVDSGEENSSVYLASGPSVKRIGKWEWGRKNILEKIEEELLTDIEVNNEIYLRYIKGEAGESVGRVIEDVFFEAFKDFEKGLAAALYNEKNVLQKYPRLPVFIRSGFPLPEKVYKKRISYDGRRFGLKPVGSELAVADLFAEEGVAVSEELSKTVLQRIKWLMA